ncbi:unnamed protein product [Parascedosporium putredinis]|uniref:Uncharacterized protein n=1 Tax=Parascedosporium putredinis TaxID=1442378 RepID=A0A9P1MA89_9PEZI|nr:unnamed protein product [Parascedosporium putredinis]CAI7997039.1 unnamed protein product [Parascedosporium putredinis]
MEEATPPWGSLPVEQYLVRNWDWACTDDDDDQRRRLVEKFIDEDVLEPEVSMEGPRLLTIAQKLWKSGPPDDYYFLRTHYGGGSDDDAKLEEWLNQDPCEGVELNPEDKWWVVLDDAELFDFGDDWQRVYKVLPELAAPRARRGFTSDAIREIYDFATMHGEADEDDYEDAIRCDAACAVAWLLILDEEAFREGELGLMFRDSHGNVVKDSSIKPDQLRELYIYNFRGAQRESSFWLDAAIGKKYKTRGKIMRTILPQVMALEQTDP